MRQMRYAAIAGALVGALAACSEDRAGTAPAAADEQTTSASPAPRCPAVAIHHDELAPGCWAIKARSVPGSPLAELDLPAGFSGNDAWVWVNADNPDRWGAITLVPVGDVYLDPCTRAGTPAKVGPTVEDFAAALADQKVTTATEPVPVSLDGHDGVYLEMSVPPGFDIGSCRDEAVVLWQGAGTEDPSADPEHLSRHWVLDVDGQRFVLSVTTAVDADTQTVERFTDIVEAATFAQG